jgi:hypothetical protein
MKPRITLFVLAFASTVAFAQSDRPIDSGGLHQTEYPDPRGTVTVRWGQPPARPAEARPSFAAIDRNGDGQIDESEASAYLTLANDFDYADTNHDRRVSRREFDRW